MTIFLARTTLAAVCLIGSTVNALSQGGLAPKGPPPIAVPAAPAAPAPAPAALAPAPAVPSLVPVPLSEAIQRAALTLMVYAPDPGFPGETRELVIDPLIDGHTGAQNATTVRMGLAITDLVKTTFSRFKVVPFTSANVTRQPLALIGTFRPLNTKAIASAEPDAYHICLALVDLKTGTIASKGVSRAMPAGVDATPTQAFRDSPLWVADPAVTGYIRSCQTTRVGDKIDQVYGDRVIVGTIISDAINAYNAKRYKEALDLYRSALASSGGEQPRVHSGIYLSSWRLKQTAEAATAFTAMVDQGIKSSKLSAQFLFSPNSPIFVAGPESEYDLWLRIIGERALAANACLEVVGHTSRAGLPAINDVLSVRRAEYVRNRLVAKAPALAERLLASGVGSRELVIGTTPDNPQNAIDRRVEFKAIKCAT